ncbi:ABC transporter ATP-binding protein [Corynebacterium cystitidis]|uniref:ABC transporter ATP-binding protein n=1 Tax=Corynebacterium cystitidis TaxID=35757 RepID=UPI00211E8D88|nr:ABC transporter ATP-binding protein [Corynebacterium cystitidis]
MANLTNQEYSNTEPHDRPQRSVVLDIQDLHKSFGSGANRKDVLKGLSLRVHQGETVALLGANGAGKTTAVNIASTLLLPTSGTVKVCGYDVMTDDRQVRQHISLTGQFAAVDGELTGKENLVFFARLNGLNRKQAATRADELLASFRLTDAANQRASTYSGGMRRRLDIAASLIVDPSLLFLDEPTTGLDPLSRRELWEMVDDLRNRGVAILLTTQYLEEAERLADNIVLLRDGTAVTEGTASQLRSQFGGLRCTLSFDDVATTREAAQEILPRALKRDIEDFQVLALEVSFSAPHGMDDLLAATQALDAAGTQPTSAGIAPPSLDDVFVGTAFSDDAVFSDGAGQAATNNEAQP